MKDTQNILSISALAATLAVVSADNTYSTEDYTATAQYIGFTKTPLDISTIGYYYGNSTYSTTDVPNYYSSSSVSYNSSVAASSQYNNTAGYSMTYSGNNTIGASSSYSSIIPTTSTSSVKTNDVTDITKMSSSTTSSSTKVSSSSLSSGKASTSSTSPSTSSSITSSTTSTTSSSTNTSTKPSTSTTSSSTNTSTKPSASTTSSSTNTSAKPSTSTTSSSTNTSTKPSTSTTSSSTNTSTKPSTSTTSSSTNTNAKPITSSTTSKSSTITTTSKSSTTTTSAKPTTSTSSTTTTSKKTSTTTTSKATTSKTTTSTTTTAAASDAANYGSTTPANPLLVDPEIEAYQEIGNIGYLLDESDSALLLKLHNDVRSLHEDTPDLVWNNTLVAQSYEYMQYLINDDSTNSPCSGNLIHSGGKFGSNIGENLAAANGNNITALFDLWSSEGEYYDYDNPSLYGGPSDEELGHFTQLVWKSTTSVGCGVQVCSDNDWTYLICRYYSEGNILYSGDTWKLFKENVLPLTS